MKLFLTTGRKRVVKKKKVINLRSLIMLSSTVPFRKAGLKVTLFGRLTILPRHYCVVGSAGQGMERCLQPDLPTPSFPADCVCVCVFVLVKYTSYT